MRASSPKFLGGIRAGQRKDASINPAFPPYYVRIPHMDRGRPRTLSQATICSVEPKNAGASVWSLATKRMHSENSKISVEDSEWKPNMKQIKHTDSGPAGPRDTQGGPEMPRETELRPRRGGRGRRRGDQETATDKSGPKPAFFGTSRRGGIEGKDEHGRV